MATIETDAWRAHLLTEPSMIKGSEHLIPIKCSDPVIDA